MIAADLPTLRRLGLAALAAFAFPAAAHPDGDAAKETHVERVIVVHDSKPGGEPSKTERVRSFQIVTTDGDAHGAPGQQRMRITSEGCDGGDKSEVNESSADGREKTHILICGRGISADERAKRLEEALVRIEKNERISAEHRERVAAALREAIDGLRQTR